MATVLNSIRMALKSIWSSVSQTAMIISHSMKRGDAAELRTLLNDGSPLEESVVGLLTVAFWALALAPVLLVPAYFLLVSL